MTNPGSTETALKEFCGLLGILSRWCALALLSSIAAVITFDNMAPDRVSDVGEPPITATEFVITAATVVAPVIVVALTLSDILARSRSKWAMLFAAAVGHALFWVWIFMPPFGLG